MSKTIDRYLRMLLTLAVTLLLAACNYQAASNVKDSVLVYCSEGSPETFNPQLSTSGTTFDASSRTLYNRLVEFAPGSTDVVPALAESWQVSADGKHYTFSLRQGVRFHASGSFQPLREFNAEDVLFSFERQWREDHPYHGVSKLSFGYFNAVGLADLLAGIEALSPHQVRFTLKRADSAFLATLAMDFASILSAEYAQHLSEIGKPQLIDTQPIGTGPFVLDRYQPDAYIRYRAHPNYWNGEQPLEKLVYAITPDASLRFARTFAGECDVMANPLPVQVEVAREKPELKVLSEPGLNIAFLSMNTEKPPFDQPLVRQAMNLAINKDSIIRVVYQNKATQAVTPLPPSLWAFDPALKDFPHDPMRAKELLSKAGYPNGFDMAIWTMSAQRAYNPNAKKMAELIQQDLKAIGVNVEISTFEFSTFLSKTRAGEHQAALMGWISDNGDPDNFFNPLLSCASKITGTNSARWCDQAFDQLLFRAKRINQLDKRKPLYLRAQRRFLNATPWVPIAHATQHVILNPRVKNFRIIPAGGVNFNQVYLEQENGEASGEQQ